MKAALIVWSLLSFPCALVAQSHQSLDMTKHSLSAGATFVIFNPDYYCPSSSPFDCGSEGNHLMKGVGTFVDYNLTPRWGAEGEFRWVHWDGAHGQKESTYLGGARFKIFRYRAAGFWLKFLIGDGVFSTNDYPGATSFSDHFLVYAPGITVNYRLTRRFSARGEYELQRWPGFAAPPTGGKPHDHGLLPNGFSFGFAYTLTPR